MINEDCHDDKIEERYFQEILDLLNTSFPTFLVLTWDHYLVQIIFCFY